MITNHPETKVLAVASGGGHWVQLLRLLPAFEGCDVAFATVDEGYRAQVPGHRFYTLNDATRWSTIGLLTVSLRLAWIILRERPQVVVSTGAAPGYFAVRLGHMLGAKTIWIDSMANVDCLSLSGQKIRGYADLWLTQWAHLAVPEGPQYAGSVL
ncbi:MAG TPA: UDP-N-acetylglucosamine--LPS N-acetylglucosamine transferase [Pseudolabrys sp.]|nr:UDP-N-acetylglucosamine--LPS N-acetylglucosamine transferase [Pseudolabrys sp.]